MKIFEIFFKVGKNIHKVKYQNDDNKGMNIPMSHNKSTFKIV